MSYKLQEHCEWYGDPGRVAVICAGNDVRHGVEYCESTVKEISKWNPTLFNVIPESTYRPQDVYPAKEN